MRICHLAKYYPPAVGGMEAYVQTLAQTQARLGMQVQVFCLGHDVDQPTMTEQDGNVEVTRFRSAIHFAKLNICPGLTRRIRRLDADIIHLHAPNPSMILSCLLARPRVPIVVTYQSDVVRQKIRNLAFAPLEALFYRRVRNILCTSRAYLEGSKFLLRYRERTHVVPMGIDLSPYREVTPQDAMETENIRRRYAGPIWLACSRLVYYKALGVALRALSMTPGTLVIVGDGPERDSLLAETRRLNLENRVVFLGQMAREKVIPYYRAATALWLSSNQKSEAFGLVQVEAMAAGCPVINTEIAGSGVSWVSGHEISGLTVPINDPRALSEAACRLVNQPELRHRLAVGARERVEQLFGHFEMTRLTVKAYRMALAAAETEGAWRLPKKQKYQTKIPAR